jgi:hypothetical protein
MLNSIQFERKGSRGWLTFELRSWEYCTLKKSYQESLGRQSQLILSFSEHIFLPLQSICYPEVFVFGKSSKKRFKKR